MKPLDIVICDDEATAISIVSASVKALLSAHAVNSGIRTFQNPADCLRSLETQMADLIFLDIAMPEMDGIQLARQILELPAAIRPELVFISSRQERVFETFEVRPLGFIRKNHFMEDIAGILTRYLNLAAQQNTGSNTRYLEVLTGASVSLIECEKIIYIESYRNNQTAFLSEGDPVSMHTTMDALTEQLKNMHFLRIHKGYIVNCSAIKQFGRTELLLFSGKSLPVGRTYYHDAMNTYMKYIRTNGAIGMG